ncbi:hypothetical protein KQX54_017398 [Cotesia glomerata]|uniref:Uncharacterized protein n=1 Tax=Cotesia glomerata TaxID=32391 RepID=A0AAV7IFY3_COTGL|nr:hypothetical protein KQX54_017398 [Cotesia glomerata]
MKRLKSFDWLLEKFQFFPLIVSKLKKKYSVKVSLVRDSLTSYARDRQLGFSSHLVLARVKATSSRPAAIFNLVNYGVPYNPPGRDAAGFSRVSLVDGVPAARTKLSRAGELDEHTTVLP